MIMWDYIAPWLSLLKLSSFKLIKTFTSLFKYVLKLGSNSFLLVLINLLVLPWHLPCMLLHMQLCKIFGLATECLERCSQSWGCDNSVCPCREVKEEVKCWTILLHPQFWNLTGSLNKSGQEEMTGGRKPGAVKRAPLSEHQPPHCYREEELALHS